MARGIDSHAKPTVSRTSAALHAQIEELAREARRLVSAGKQSRALKTYQTAADLAPKDGTLQLRAAELARTLNERDVAISYFRRAAQAFHVASARKQAAAALRCAWTLARDALPKNASVLIQVTRELAEAQHALGFHGEAKEVVERTNLALEAHRLLDRV